MKNALICLEQLGIGGVETFTITQVEEFARRKIKCYVLARDGLLAEKLKDLKNIEFVEFDFKLENRINTEKVEYLKKFVKEKKIDFIYVHQFSCVPYILPVVFETRIPYIAYLHNIVPKTCEWFMDHYDIYKVLFPIYFECASKIKQPYNNLMWFGRVSEQKRTSIETAIKFYKYYKEKYNSNAVLTIVGDGEIFEEMKEKHQDKSIIFKGAVSDMIPEIEKSDILLGVDRCMLEAVASKKPAVVCGYKGNVILITPKNIKDAIEENFTGINLNDDKDELFKYKEKDLLKIINENYDYVSKHLTITDSVYLDIEKFTGDSKLTSVFNGLNYYVNRIKSLEAENKELYLKTQELYQEINKLNKYLRKSVIGRIIKKIDKTKGEK